MSAKLITCDEARRIAENFAKLPELLRKPQNGGTKITAKAIVSLHALSKGWFIASLIIAAPQRLGSRAQARKAKADEATCGQILPQMPSLPTAELRGIVRALVRRGKMPPISASHASSCLSGSNFER